MQSSHLFINPISTPLHVNVMLKTLEIMNSEKDIDMLTVKVEHVRTLSERLWTSAARDLFVDVDPQVCFLASADSKSTSFLKQTK